jgi:Bacterial Ig-like domain
MKPRSIYSVPTAVMLACALLAGCGGGDAEAPPAPVAATPMAPPPAAPDTTAPTVTVANDVSATTATGPVTFTFVFSEDVGVSFDRSDITVTGGTAGAFVRVSGSQATLVVTPPVNTNGTLTVSVAAARFTDLAGNANAAAATGSKAYDVRIPTAPTIAAPTPPTRLAADVRSIFSDAYTPIAGIDLNPSWGQSTVATTEVIAGNNTRRYGTLNYQGIDFAGTPTNVSTMTRLHIDLWTSNVTSVLVSIISAGPAENAVTLTPTLSGWNSFDIDLAQYTVPNKNAIIQIKIEGTPGGGILYFDNLYFWKPATPVPTGTSLVTFDEATAPTLTDFGTNGAPPTVVPDPAGGSNKVLRVAKYATPAPGSEQWAGVTVSTGAGDTIPAIAFSATAKIITMRVYSPAVGVRVRMKVEKATDAGVSVETDALTTVAGAWETLSFNFANPGLNPPVGGGATAPLNLAQTYNRLSIFSDFGLGNGGSGPLPANRVYYYDDITLAPPVAGGGGGGGGTVTAQTFSTGFAAANRTPEGGAYFSYSGSNLDGFNCTGGDAVCGSGSGGTGATSFFFAYYQTTTPATALYNGISVLAPGVVARSTTADTAGVAVSGQTTVNFTFNNNPEWQASGTNNFGVILTLGKFYNVGTLAAPQACNVQLLAVVSPLANGAATAYAVPFSSFQVIQNCNTSLNTVSAALASAPVAEIAFQAAGGTAALPTVGGRTTGANLSVAAGGVYPTTLALTGGISFRP